MRIPSFLFVCALSGSTSWAYSSQAHDEDNPYYVQLGLGAVFSEDADVGSDFGGTIGFDPGYTASLVLGRTFDLNDRWSWDAQFETLYQRFTVDEDDIRTIPGLQSIEIGDNDVAKSLTFLINGILDWHMTQQFRIFGGAGVGWAKAIDYNAWNQGALETEEDDGLAFQGRLGFGYNFGGSYDVLFGYRYYKTEPIDVTENDPSPQSSEIDIAQHSLEFAFRWGL
jgi:opacity protein-like surface antigen